MKKGITILIKPASSLCNMRCKYCFYADIAENREIESFGVMTNETATAVIEKGLDFADGGSINFAFQGGEPTVAPLEFFKFFVETVKKLNTNKTAISYALQTNGTLITKPHCKFFAENNFLIGVSLDGKADLHNTHRVDAERKGTFNKVMKTIDMFKKYKVEFNIIAVVTSLSARSAASTYKFFRSHGFNFMQFIICLDPMGVKPLSGTFSPDNDGYFNFYKTILDLYIQDKRNGEPVYIRYLDNLLGMLNGQTPELCGMSGACGGQLIVEGNGNCYPCDFYCEDKYLLGNINQNSLEEMGVCENMMKFKNSSLKIDAKCKSCSVFKICRGGCRRDRDYMSTGELDINMYCEGRKKFFEYFLSVMNYKL
ncbi:MAG: SPASM domain-containing protein [Bacillota bacterium]